MTFLDAIYKVLAEKPYNHGLAVEFCSEKCSLKRYVIGRNDESLSVLKNIKIDGVIDDFAVDDAWNGVPIVKLASVSGDAIVLNCSTSISPVNVIIGLNDAGLKNIINFCDFASVVSDMFTLPDFVLKQRRDCLENEQEWSNLFELLADEESKSTLIDVIRFRLTANPIYMGSYKVRLQNQYFEPFMRSNNDVFVDAGGFDGDTTEEFCRRYPDYRAVYFFEPSPKNMSAARTRLAGKAGINFIPLGLSDRPDRLFFSSEAGSASSVSESGDLAIDVVKLDDEVPGRVSFIKMDLEGWELKALAGCARHIVEDHPKLAISVYHAAADFRNIPEFVLSLRSDYRVYLRHYTQGWSETVMYFVPV